MKKLLSILLVLILFICAFVSCNDEPQTESSESESQSVVENAPAKTLATFSEAITSEDYATYYKVIDFKSNEGALALNGNTEGLFVIDSYAELAESVSNPTLVDAQIFEGNFVIAYKNSNYFHITDLKGLHSLSIDGSTATVIAESVHHSSLRGDGMPRDFEMFILVPRAELNGKNIDELEFTLTPRVFSECAVRSVATQDFDYKDGSMWLLRTQEEHDAFNAIHKIDTDSTLALVVYRKGDCYKKLIAYADPSISLDGKIFKINCYQTTNGSQEQVTAAFDIIYIDTRYAFSVGIGDDTVSQISIKNIVQK